MNDYQSYQLAETTDQIRLLAELGDAPEQDLPDLLFAILIGGLAGAVMLIGPLIAMFALYGGWQ
ncbi:MAG: hypothetical protein HC911_11775 [Chloroflexaceae bacterium]|nr:hypothetical protein [Chloroflexaceae bacterium]